ncbi:sulfotransferase family 2 domain-containing protein [Christiangramia crocea]|uniref:Sulfotransferase family protein n=1 Tax=Christiangramia crocea TaxID=2904124 RepID=A0A9X1UZ02_9FLAO|nr:sulfotransferase family 2 domain-containing protein [Gramella crocea]MCG9973012.1 sulfotransferase family protein [Gramella crocea]
MINHRYKCIFIHIPKTGGSSINKFLSGGVALNWVAPDYDLLYGWCPERKIHMQHATPFQLLSTGLVTPEQWNTYFKFCFVRNPWERALSDYLWMMKDTHIKDSFKNFILKKGRFKRVLLDDSRKAYRGDHLDPQHIFAKPDNGDLDYIGRFENFSEEMAKICEILDIPNRFSEHEKKSDTMPSHYSLFYTGSQRKLIEENYQEDIQLFDYSFEEQKKGLEKLKNLF